MRPVPLRHEGRDLKGELFLPEAPGPHPGVIVAHSGLGLLAHERKVASDLAALGHAALAIDMFGGEVDGTPEAAGALFAELAGNPALLRARMIAWHDALAALPEIDAERIAALGYCFGGMCVLELARSGAGLKAAISFHGLLSTASPASNGGIAGEIVAWCAGNDPYVPPAHIDAFRAEMAEAQARCQITVFGAHVGHGFTDPAVDALARPGIGFDALADRVSWAGTVALLGAVI